MQLRNIMLGTAAVLGLAAVAAAQPQCGVGSIRGTWAMNLLGWAIPMGPPGAQPAPIVGIVALTIDYAGHLTGSGTIMWGTGIAGTPLPPETCWTST